MQQGDHREKISRALLRRPDPSDLRQYMFWLVDVIYACKATKEPVLLQQAQVLEDALGHFGAFLEHGAAEDFSHLEQKLSEFARFITTAPGGASAAAAVARP